MTFDMVLLAISYKHGGLCVAGIRLDNLEYVRLTHNYQSIRASEMVYGPNNLLIEMDIINVSANKLKTDGCHSEDYDLLIINEYVGRMNIKELDKIYMSLEHSHHVYIDSNYKLSISQGSKVKFSLELFKVKNFETSYHSMINDNGQTYLKPQGSFVYNDVKYNNIRITDSVCCGYPKIYGNGYSYNFQEGYILVSLPNDEWSYNNEFFKYIAGIIA